MRQTYQVGYLYQPKDIIENIWDKCGVQISYDKTWRARYFAFNSIKGSHEESYSALSSYCYILEQKNPRTITNRVIYVNNYLKYHFMIFSACIFEFHILIRLAIALDGTFLK